MGNSRPSNVRAQLETGEWTMSLLIDMQPCCREISQFSASLTSVSAVFLLPAALPTAVSAALRGAGKQDFLLIAAVLSVELEKCFIKWVCIRRARHTKGHRCVPIRLCLVSYPSEPSEKSFWNDTRQQAYTSVDSQFSRGNGTAGNISQLWQHCRAERHFCA
jgi:hypothetical protein